MDRRMLDVALPMVYGLLVAVMALTKGPLVIVAVVGAMLIGIYFAAVRPSLVRKEQARGDTVQP